MKESGKHALPDDKDKLLTEIDVLKNQIYRQQMELDILNKAVEITKKGKGIDPRKMANKEKAFLIDALRTKYPLKELLKMIDISKSSYFYQKESQIQPDKYAILRTKV